MMLRMRFAKEENLRWIGHLDVMRSLQRHFRRAGIDMLYSQGFSPHPVMSIALPLGLGMTSGGEYLDLGAASAGPEEELLERLDRTGTEGLKILRIRRVGESRRENAMAVVRAASWRIGPGRPEDGSFPGITAARMAEAAGAMMAEESLVMLRRTKKKEEYTDIRPLILSWSCAKEGIDVVLAAGSERTLSPELFCRTLCRFLSLREDGLTGSVSGTFPEEGEEASMSMRTVFRIHRKDIFTENEGTLVSLGEIGELPG